MAIRWMTCCAWRAAAAGSDRPTVCGSDDDFKRPRLLRRPWRLRASRDERRARAAVDWNTAADKGWRQAPSECARGPRARRRSAHGQDCEAVLGLGAVAFRATLFDKSPGANWLVVWHQDTALPLQERIEHPQWGPWSTKAGVLYAHAPAWALDQVVALRISLDDSTLTNGPLRTSGTHRGGVYSDAQVEQFARSTEAVDCVTPSGGVVAMRPLTIHASSKSSDDQPRRVLHIEYASTTCLGPGVELVLA